MLSIGEDILKCDMAETYHLYIVDWYDPPFPISYLADLAQGLSEDSRIKRKIINKKLTLAESLQAIMIDKLSILIWQKTKDGAKGRNIPESIYRKLEGLEKKPKDELQSFRTEEEFMEWYNSKMR
jgi:hypothetical protein